MFDFSNYSSKSKYYDASNTLVFGKMINEMGGVAIEEFVGLNPKIYSILITNSSEYKKAKGVNRNVAPKIGHNNYKYVLLNKNFLRHSIN